MVLIQYANRFQWRNPTLSNALSFIIQLHLPNKIDILGSANGITDVRRCLIKLLGQLFKAYNKHTYTVWSNWKKINFEFKHNLKKSQQHGTSGMFLCAHLCLFVSVYQPCE